MRGNGLVPKAKCGTEGSRGVFAVAQLQIAQATVIKGRRILESSGHTGHAICVNGQLIGFAGLKAARQPHPVTGIVAVIEAETAEHVLRILIIACLVQAVGIGVSGFHGFLADVEHVRERRTLCQSGLNGVKLLFRKARGLCHVQKGGLDIFFLIGILSHDSSLY